MKEVKKDIPDDRDLLEMPELLGNNLSNTHVRSTRMTPQTDQSLWMQIPHMKEPVHCNNRTNQANKATPLEGNLIELLNQGGSPDDKNPLMNQEVADLSNRLGINEDNHHSVPKNANHIQTK